MKKIILAIAMCASLIADLNAQESADKVSATISADIVSQYIWRGQKLGEAAVQPTLGVEYKGVSFSAWGSTGITDWNDTKEFDLTLGYSAGGFNIGVTDYWFNTPNPKYFAYSAHDTSHIFEANIGCDLDVVSLQWYTNFAGNDGVNHKGKRAYSSYVEATVPFSLGGLEWSGVLGAVPYATTSYSDANGFAVVNVALSACKELRITESFSLPIWAKVIANPSNQKAAFVVGLTIKP